MDTVMFLTIVLAVTSQFLVKSVTPGCPPKCSCEIQSDSCIIDCTARLSEVLNNNTVFVTSLSDDINNILSTMNTTLRRLIVRNCTLLEDVPLEVCNMRLLQSITLRNIGLKRLPENCFARLPDLVSLEADHNSIVTLQDGLFDGLVHLQTIDLGNNAIKSIGVLSKTSNLHSLNNINFISNKLTELDISWPFILAQNVQRVTITLNNNAIKQFTNKQHWRFQCGMKMNQLFLNMQSNEFTSVNSLLKSLNFTRYSDVLCFLILEVNLQMAHDRNYVCDCMDFNLLATFKGQDVGNMLTEVRCSNVSIFYRPASELNFIAGHHPRAPSLQLDELACSIQHMCPVNCRCVNQPSNRTFHILCQNADLTDLPDSLPPPDTPRSPFIITGNRYKLNFSDNRIISFTYRQYIRKATIVDLSSSRLVNITDETMLALENVNKIYLHNNQLTTLPTIATTINFTFSTLSLYNNPLLCNCDQLWLKHWLVSVSDRLENSEGIHCSSASTKITRGKNIFSVNDTDFCNSNPLENLDTNALVITVSLSVCAFIILIGLILICRFRVKVYTTLGVHPFDRDECEGEDMLYDVFISCAHEDNQQARELHLFLESHSLRVCYYENDFMPGNPILHCIHSAISSSKRVLCLVSDHFISSPYCLEEFERALHFHISLNRRRLIVVMSEHYELPTEDNQNSGQYGRGPDGTTTNDESECLVGEQRSDVMMSSSEAISRRFEILRNFIARNVYIRVNSDVTSWHPQLLYAMPLRRLGESRPV